MVPFRKTVRAIASQIPLSPHREEKSAASGILKKFKGVPIKAGGSESPAPEKAPLVTTSIPEKNIIVAVILLKTEATISNSKSLVKTDAT